MTNFFGRVDLKKANIDSVLWLLVIILIQMDNKKAEAEKNTKWGGEVAPEYLVLKPWFVLKERGNIIK